MGVEVKRIDAQTWIMDEGGVRFFLLTGSEKALLIDSGMMTRNAKELAAELTDLPLELINTHADPDHIGSNGEFDRFYMNPAEAANYYKNFGKKEGNLEPVWDGDVLNLGDRPLRILETPGHTPGSIAIIDIKYRRVYSGDPVQDGHIFMFGPMREMHAYRLSLKRLLAASADFDEIYPSHGTCPVFPDLIEKLYEGAGKVLAGTAEGTETEVHGNRIMNYNVGCASFLCEVPEK
ncbi:MAG: MBL fold metallo-hydrolase [Lachnospiraceae bacterium]|nr:MBL fold metallo-hydrolase [Lachnospiraceae bacterium]